MMETTLFVSHGAVHMQHDYGYLPLRHNLATFFRTGVMVDINPRSEPDYVMDVTDKACSGAFRSQFDNIFVMATPSCVLKNKQFWKNVYGWLKPRGMILSMLPRYSLRLSRMRSLSAGDFSSKVKNWVPRFTRLDPNQYTSDASMNFIALRKN